MRLVWSNTSFCYGQRTEGEGANITSIPTALAVKLRLKLLLALCKPKMFMFWIHVWFDLCAPWPFSFSKDLLDLPLYVYMQNYGQNVGKHVGHYTGQLGDFSASAGRKFPSLGSIPRWLLDHLMVCSMKHWRSQTRNWSLEQKPYTNLARE